MKETWGTSRIDEIPVPRIGNYVAQYIKAYTMIPQIMRKWALNREAGKCAPIRGHWERGGDGNRYFFIHP